MKYTYFGFEWPDFGNIYIKLLTMMMARHIKHNICGTMNIEKTILYSGQG